MYIYLQSNRITKIEGLQNLVSLRELYLSHNGIEVIEGLENNVSYRNSTAYFWKDWVPNCPSCIFLAEHVQQSSICLFCTFKHCFCFPLTEKAYNPGHCSQSSKENWKHQPFDRTAGVLGTDDGLLLCFICIIVAIKPLGFSQQTLWLELAGKMCLFHLKSQ